jgi:hypothetical protein
VSGISVSYCLQYLLREVAFYEVRLLSILPQGCQSAHPAGSHSRIDDWLGHLPAEGVRQIARTLSRPEVIAVVRQRFPQGRGAEPLGSEQQLVGQTVRRRADSGRFTAPTFDHYSVKLFRSFGQVDLRNVRSHDAGQNPL